VPNHCENGLAISGPPEIVMELVRAVDGPEEPFDFETLLPVPPEIAGPAGQEQGEPGLPVWYEWARTHWGVKWNAWGGRRRGYGRTGRVRYRFFTAYGPPDAFLDHVAARWPEVTMELEFWVELLGEGTGLWRDGRCVDLDDEVPV
jgi:hypothetical protein